MAQVGTGLAIGTGLNQRGERRAAPFIARGIDVNGAQRPRARRLGVEGARPAGAGRRRHGSPWEKTGWKGAGDG